MTSVTRMLMYIDFKQIKKSEFYRKTKLSNGYLDKVKELGSDKVESIISIFPDINLEWLLTGRGEMIKKEPTSEKFVPFDDARIKTLEAEISQLKDKLIATLEENTRLQKENTRLKDEAATKKP